MVGGRVGDEDCCAAEVYGERRGVGTGGCRRRGSGRCGLMRLLWAGGVYGTDLWYGVDDLGWNGCLKGVVEGDDVVA